MNNFHPLSQSGRPLPHSFEVRVPPGLPPMLLHLWKIAVIKIQIQSKMNINKTQFPPNDYETLNLHSPVFLPVKSAAAYILGVMGLLCVPLQSLPWALPWQRRMPGSLPALRESRSLFIHQSTRMISSMARRYSPPPQRALILAKMLGWKICQDSNRWGMEEWFTLSHMDFTSARILEKGTVAVDSLLVNRPPTSAVPIPCQSPIPCLSNHRDTWSGSLTVVDMHRIPWKECGNTGCWVL